MILHIDTTDKQNLVVGLEERGRLLVKREIRAPRKQADKLLPAIERLLLRRKISAKAIKGVRVVERGGSFTSLRIGVVSANAIAYALGVRVSGAKKDSSGLKAKGFFLVEPKYSAPPNIANKNKVVD